MKLVSWNVNGLRACVSKGFVDSVLALDADVICLQETKLQESQLDVALPGYQVYLNCAEKKGYSGTAIFTRVPPLAVEKGMGMEEHDREGRILRAEFADFQLINCYTPNSQKELARLDYRMKWEDDFRAFLTHQDARRPVIVCGDLNVAATAMDLKNPSANRHSAGFTDQERGKFAELLAAGFTDTFRLLHPDEIKYSWWSYIGHARERNAGWRIDYFLVSDWAKGLIRAAEIHNEIFGSDHCPVSLEIEV